VPAAPPDGDALRDLPVFHGSRVNLTVRRCDHGRLHPDPDDVRWGAAIHHTPVTAAAPARSPDPFRPATTIDEVRSWLAAAIAGCVVPLALVTITGAEQVEVTPTYVLALALAALVLGMVFPDQPRNPGHLLPAQMQPHFEIGLFLAAAQSVAAVILHDQPVDALALGLTVEYTMLLTVLLALVSAFGAVLRRAARRRR
jgi:hypothetical protein